MHMTEEEIKRELKQWLEFTSTTKNLEIAKIFAGDTIFVIKLPVNEYSSGVDIFSCSMFPQEEEALLPTQICFRVTQISYEEWDTQPTNIIHVDTNILAEVNVTNN